MAVTTATLTARFMYQNETLSVRVSDEFMQAAIEGRDGGRIECAAVSRANAKRRARCCAKSPRDTRLRRSRDAVRYDDPQMAHVQGNRPPEFDGTPVRNISFSITLPATGLAQFDEVKARNGEFDIERFQKPRSASLSPRRKSSSTPELSNQGDRGNSHIFRTLGLGYSNLGSLIMSYGYGYDSVEGRALCGAITAIMTGEAYGAGARMARAMGRFRVIATPVAADGETGSEKYVAGHARSGRSASRGCERDSDHGDLGFLKKEPQKCGKARRRWASATVYRCPGRWLAPTARSVF